MIEHIILRLLFIIASIGFIWANNRGFCFHRFKTGGGGMGDAWACSKCGLDKYPEHIGFKLIYILLKRTEKL